MKTVVADSDVVEPIKADVKRFVRIVRANAESVSPETAKKLREFADKMEKDLRALEKAA